MNQARNKEILFIGALLLAFSILVAGIGLFFYQGLAALDNEIGENNDLVFLVPKDKQKEDILDAIERLELDLKSVDVISDDDLRQLQSLEELLDLQDEFRELDALLEQ